MVEKAEAKVTVVVGQRGMATTIRQLVISDGQLGLQDSNNTAGGPAVLAPLATWGGRLRQLQDALSLSHACLAGGQMIQSPRGHPTGDGWPLTCDTADEALMAAGLVTGCIEGQ